MTSSSPSLLLPSSASCESSSAFSSQFRVSVSAWIEVVLLRFQKEKNCQITAEPECYQLIFHQLIYSYSAGEGLVSGEHSSTPCITFLCCFLPSLLMCLPPTVPDVFFPPSLTVFDFSLPAFARLSASLLSLPHRCETETPGF